MSERFEGTVDYIATDDLKIAVNAAVALERPLLIKGEPGTGKTVLAYEVAKALDALMAPDRRRPALLAASLAVNLGVLVFFKLRPAIAPLGVSFYTFHSISYVVDVFRRQARPERSFPRYALYVAFFPKIVAGPAGRPHPYPAPAATIQIR